MAQLILSGTKLTTGSALEQALQLVEARLDDWASNSDAYNAMLLEIFGAQSSDASRALQTSLSGSGLGIRLEILAGDALSGINGAYTSAAPGGGERIYLNGTWLQGARAAEIEAVLLEELGHAIDHQLNGDADTPGDEGEIFSARLRGKQAAPSAATENDQRLISLNGIAVAIEAADTTAPTGSLFPTAPAYAPVARSGLGFVGYFAKPTFADADGDGDLDLFIGERFGNTLFFRNTANPGATALAYDAGATNPFGISDVGFSASPAFADADGDGDLDLFIGNFDGDTLFFRNTGSSTAPAYAAAVTNPFGISSVGLWVTPAFADADADGDLDLFIGDGFGNTHFFRNTTAPGATAPAYAALSTNPFGIRNVGSFARPAFADADGDGDLDLFIGNERGNILFFRNNGSRIAPAYDAASTNPFGISNIGNSASPAFADADADGDLDLFIAYKNGCILFFKNTSATPVAPVASSNSNGSYGIGAAITLTVQFSEVVLITTTGGTPTLQLETGAIDRVATYLSGSGTNTLSFRYIVQAGDTSSDLDQLSANALTLNGGTIKDAAGNNAILTLAAPGAAGSLAVNAALVIDGIAPTTTAAITAIVDNFGIFQGTVASSTTTDDSSLSISGTISAALAAGETVRIYDGVTFLGNATISGNTWIYFDSRILINNQSVSYTAQVADAAGNQSAAGSAYTATLDLIAPTTTAAVTAITDNVGIVQGTVASGATTDDTTPTISGTISAALATGETLRIFNGTTLLGSATVNNTTKTWSFTPTALPNTAGTAYAITARVADAAGNLGTASATRSFTLDTTAPSTTAAITALTDDIGLIQGNVAASAFTDDTTPTISGTISAALATGETLRIFNGTTLLGSATVNNTTKTWSFTPTALPNTAGTTYAITARVADAAGNLGTASATRSFTLDTTAPSTTAAITAITDDFGIFQGTVASGTTTDDSSLAISGTISAALATNETVRIYDGTTYLGNASVSGNNWSYTDSRTPTNNQTISYTAQVADAAGNQSAAGTAYTVTVDLTVPTSTAAVTAIADDFGIVTGTVASGTTTDDSSLAISGTISAALAAGETVRIYDGSTYLGNASVSGTTWSYADTRTLTNTQSVSYTAQVADAAGNQSAAGSAYNATLDTAAPITTATVTAITDNVGIVQGTVASGSTTDDSSLAISGTLSAALAAGDTVRIYDGSTYLGNASVSGTTWSYADSRTLANNQSVSYTTRVADAAGNQSAASTAYNAALDTAAPTTTAAVTAITDNAGIVQGTVASGSTTDDSSLSISGTLSTALAANETVRIYDGTSFLGTATVSGTTWSYADSRTLTNNQSVSYTAQVADAAGNLSAAGTAYTATLDLIAPTTTAAVTAITDNVGIVQGTVASGATTDDTTPTISGTISAALATGESLRIFNGTTLLGSATVNNTTKTWSFTPTALPNTASTAYAITARVADAAGNLGTASATRSFTLDTTAPSTTASITAVADDIGLIPGNVAASAFTDDTTPTISGTISAALATGETLRIFNGTTLLGSATVNNTTKTWSFTPTALPNTASTAYAITARVADAAGNLGTASATRSFTLDTTAPSTTAAITAITDDFGLIQGNVAAGTTTDDTTPTISGTISAALAAGETVRIYDGTTYLGNASATGSGTTWSYADSRTLINNQSVSYTAQVADAAGNLSAAGTAYTATLDLIAPTTTAVVTAITDNIGIVQGTVASGATTDDTTPTISGTISAALATGESLRIFNGTNLLGSATVSNTTKTWSFTPTALPNTASTAYAITARVADAAGNLGTASATRSFTLDTTAPSTTAAITAITDDFGLIQGNVAAGTTTDDTTPTISGTISAALAAGETVRIYDGTTYLGNASATGSGTTWSYADSRTLINNQSVGYTAQVADAAGNQSAAGTVYTATIDTTATAPSLALVNDTGISNTDGITNVGMVNVGGLETGASWQYSINGGSTWLPGTGTSFFLSSGSYDAGSILARQSDLAGNISANGQLGAITIDTTAPTGSLGRYATAPAYAAPSTNPFGLTGVGFHSRPSFVDIDADGDLDAFIGDYYGNTLFFRNTAASGSTNPAYAVATTNPFGLSDVGSSASPSFVDIDGDGDLDAFIGEKYGNTLFFRNTATSGSTDPAYAAATTATTFGITDVGYVASPSFVDIDGDGDLDAFIGERYGNTLIFRNTAASGSANPAYATAINATTFGLTNVGPYASPCLVDIDGDGDLDAFIGNIKSNDDGSYDDNTFFFRNTATSGSTDPAYAAAINATTFGLTNVGTYASPSLVDIDGDGDLDAFIGNYDGNTLFFRNTAPALGVSSTTANGSYGVGAVINLSLTLSEAVLVTGTPQLQLETGVINRFAVYSGGSGTNTLSFSYTVQAGDTSSDLDLLSANALTLNGGTIKDAAGNNALLTLAAPGSPASLAARKNLVIDTTAPTGSFSSTIATDTGITSTISTGGLTKDNTLGLAGTYADANGVTSVKIYDGVTNLGNASLNSGNWSYTTAALSDGSHFFTAKVIDAAGNALTTSPAVTATVDTTAPTTTAAVTAITDNVGIVTGTIALGATTDDSSLSISGTISVALATGETVRIYDGSTYLGNASVTGTTWSYADSRTLNNNQNVSYTARIADAAGNQSAAGTVYSATVDTTAPTVAITSIGGADKTVSSQTGDATMVGTAEANRLVTIKYGATALGTSTANGTGGFSYTLTAANLTTIGQGTGKSITASQSDAAGNAGISNAFNFALDTLAPTTTIAITAVNDNVGLIQGNVAAGAFTDDTTPTLNGSISAALATGDNLRIFNGTTLLGNATVNNTAKTWSFTPSTALASGFYAITARVADAAGNLATASPAQRFSIDSTANQIIGDANANTLTATTAKDVLTGLGGIDTFKFTALTSSTLANFDRLTDFSIGTDILDGPTAVAAANINKFGAVTALSATSISTLLTAATFLANRAATFSYADPSGISRSFIALNDAAAGYQSSTDAVIEITGYISSLDSLQVI